MGEANLTANAAPDFPEYLPLFYKYSNISRIIAIFGTGAPERNGAAGAGAEVLEQ